VAGGGGGDTIQPAHAKPSIADVMVNVRVFIGSPFERH